MKITCPKNPSHNRFSATAHVTETWVVDSTNEFQKVIEESCETTHKPDHEDLFTCLECGSEAKTEK